MRAKVVNDYTPAPGGLDQAGESPNGACVIRVLLADDHPTVRAALARILQDAPDMQLVGAPSIRGEGQCLPLVC